MPACHSCNNKKGGVHPDKLHLYDFPPEVMKHIRLYLSGEKQEPNKYIASDRALVPLHGKFFGNVE